MQADGDPAVVWRNAIILGLVSLSSPLAMTMYIPAFPSIAADLGVSAAAIQASVVSFLIALAMGQSFYGPLSDRLGRKAPLFVGLGLFVISSAGASLSSNVEQLVVWRFLQGLGACAPMAVPRAIVRDRYIGSAAARMMGLIILVTAAAPLIAPLAGTAMVELWGWRSIFWFLTSAGAVGIALVFSLPETHAPANRARGLETLRRYPLLLRNRIFVSRILMVGFSQGIYYSFLSASPFVFMDIYGLEAWEYSLLFALGAVSWTITAQLAPWLMDRLGSEQLLRGCLLTSLLACAFLLIVTLCGLGGPVVLMTSMLIVLSGLGILMPVGTVLALHAHGTEAGSASALLGTVGFGLCALASGVTTALADGSERPMLITMTGCALLSAALATIVARRLRSPVGVNYDGR